MREIFLTVLLAGGFILLVWTIGLMTGVCSKVFMHGFHTGWDL
jgi:hypothetical protein